MQETLITLYDMRRIQRAIATAASEPPIRFCHNKHISEGKTQHFTHCLFFLQNKLLKTLLASTNQVYELSKVKNTIYNRKEFAVELQPVCVRVCDFKSRIFDVVFLFIASSRAKCLLTGMIINGSNIQSKREYYNRFRTNS